MAEVQKCRSCGAPILWLQNIETGKTAPIDAEPNPEKGNCLVYGDGRSYQVLKATDVVASPERMHTSHFATCPQSAAWRKREPIAAK